MRTENSSRTRTRPDVTLRNVRSAITNGSALFLGDVDERGPWCRRLRDLIADQTSDLGGADAISSAELALIRRSAMLQLQLEMMEARWAEHDGEASPKALDAYQRESGALRRILATLGLGRRPRDITAQAESDLLSCGSLMVTARRAGGSGRRAFSGPHHVARSSR
jgi:hypothetical protein